MSCLYLILMNGNIVTMDADNRQAEAVAIAQGKIRAVGNDEEIRAMACEETKSIDLNGKIVLQVATRMV